MAAQVKRYILCCDLCQRVKYLSISMEGEYQFIPSAGPNDLVTVDYYGPLPMAPGGNQYIFVMLDALSKYVSLYTMKSATARMTLQKIFNNLIRNSASPSVFCPTTEPNSPLPYGKTNLSQKVLQFFIAQLGIHNRTQRSE